MKRLRTAALACFIGLLAACGGKPSNPSSSACTATPSTGADPLFQFQWHLQNTGQSGGVSGQDLDVVPAWSSCSGSTCHGEGQTICVVDAGTQIAHEDLSPNVVAGSYNYVTGSSDPTPLSASSDPISNADIAHGTATAGLAAARDSNGLGGAGVAPRAGLIAYDLLENDSTANEADSMTHGLSNFAVSSNSWGFPDGYGTLNQSASTWQAAVLSGITSGRSGKGAIYVWAAGNGDTGSPECGNCEDNSNYDGQANFRGVIAVASTDDDGTKSSYSERGANVWISGMGGEFCNDQSTHAMTSTDLMGGVGFNPLFATAASALDYCDQNYTSCMNGTSAATPEIAGAVAMILQANPALGERDVREILATSARKNDPNDPGKQDFTGDNRDSPGWKTNGAGFHINHNFGFGVADVAAAVTLAKSWTPISASQVTCTYNHSPNVAIPDNNTTGVSDTINTASGCSGGGCSAGACGITKIEWIEVTFESNHTYSGDLDITLTNNTTNTLSWLAETHLCCVLDSNDACITTPGSECVPYSGFTGTYNGGWVFGDGRHLGEAASGVWQLNVRDLAAQDTGNFQSWQITFYGR